MRPDSNGNCRCVASEQIGLLDDLDIRWTHAEAIVPAVRDKKLGQDVGVAQSGRRKVGYAVVRIDDAVIAPQLPGDVVRECGVADSRRPEGVLRDWSAWSRLTRAMRRSPVEKLPTRATGVRVLRITAAASSARAPPRLWPVAMIWYDGFLARASSIVRRTSARISFQPLRKPVCTWQPRQMLESASPTKRPVAALVTDWVPRKERTMSRFVRSSATKPLVSVEGVLRRRQRRSANAIISARRRRARNTERAERYRENSMRVVVSASSTKGQLPFAHVNLVRGDLLVLSLQ